MKNQIGIQDATPSKAVFRSIIADYDAKAALCELIDNSIDVWSLKSSKNSLNIDINIDIQRQVIKITDNAGGIKQDDLHHIVGPGHSSNDSNSHIIGIFGVGSKRAVVALSPYTTIKSRYKKNQTCSVEITDEWLKDEDWKFPVYEVTNIAESSTEIEMTKIRDILTGQSVRDIKDHISAIYGKLLTSQSIILKLNGEQLKSSHFDKEWSFNPDVPPQGYDWPVKIGGEKVNVKISGGLIVEGGDSGHGEYGVYVYCNNRLIVRSLKTPEVGFTKGQVGVPHNSISLARVIVEIEGPAGQMPWNSSKNGIDTKHKVYQLLRDKLIDVIKYYT
ncbi:ATP-binding protein, partial [Leptospira sp. id769339]